MTRKILLILMGACVMLTMLRDHWAVRPAFAAGEIAQAIPAPAFTHRDAKDWLNSPPLTWEQLRGQVVLLDFWTFDCWNCYHSIPWLHAVEQRYGGQGLRIIGVHTPELPQEYLRGNVVDKVKEFALTHPVMIDNDYSYWNAMENRYWPAFYLVDRKGRVRAIYVGETHEGDSKALMIEKTLRLLLAEAA